VIHSGAGLRLFNIPGAGLSGCHVFRISGE
jgi:hypothetical protein